MARRPSSPAPQHAQLTKRQMEVGIRRLEQAIKEVEAFSLATDHIEARAHALSASVKGTLQQTFGDGTVEYRRYQEAANFSWPILYTGPTSPQRIVLSLTRCRERSLAMLQEALAFLRRELDLAVPDDHDEFADASTPEPAANRVFVVHGRDEAAREGVARFLEKIGLDAIILHEQPDRGFTIIEKFETYASQVSFAVVLLTPDDLGGLASASTQSARARQNVVFELGYFVGKLGRGCACLLRKGDVEIPSDLYGVIYTDLDDAGAWKLKLAKELRAAGLEFDTDKVFKA